MKENDLTGLDPRDPLPGSFPTSPGSDLGATSSDAEGPAGPLATTLGPCRLGTREPEAQAAGESWSNGFRELGTAMEPGSQATSKLGIQGARHR